MILNFIGQIEVGNIEMELIDVRVVPAALILISGTSISTTRTFTYVFLICVVIALLMKCYKPNMAGYISSPYRDNYTLS